MNDCGPRMVFCSMSFVLKVSWEANLFHFMVILQIPPMIFTCTAWSQGLGFIDHTLVLSIFSPCNFVLVVNIPLHPSNLGTEWPRPWEILPNKTFPIGLKYFSIFSEGKHFPVVLVWVVSPLTKSLKRYGGSSNKLQGKLFCHKLCERVVLIWRICQWQAGKCIGMVDRCLCGGGDVVAQ